MEGVDTPALTVPAAPLTVPAAPLPLTLKAAVRDPKGEGKEVREAEMVVDKMLEGEEDTEML